jgi:hypothetical protein
MYYYKRTEPQLWTVGVDGGGEWHPDSDHDTTKAAAERVAYLNGGGRQVEQKQYALRVYGKATIRKIINDLLKAEVQFSINPVSQITAVIAVLDATNDEGVNCREVLRAAFHKAIGE